MLSETLRHYMCFVQQEFLWVESYESTGRFLNVIFQAPLEKGISIMKSLIAWLVIPVLFFCHTSAGHAEQKTASIKLTSARYVPKYQWINVTQKAAYAPRDGAGALVFKDKM